MASKNSPSLRRRDARQRLATLRVTRIATQFAQTLLILLLSQPAHGEDVDRFVAEPVLVSDRFETDTRKNYKTVGDVRWSTLKLTIPKDGTLAWVKTIEADWKCELEVWPGAVGVGDQHASRLGFALSNGNELLVVVSRAQRNGQILRQILVALIDRSTAAPEPTVEQLAISPVFLVAGDVERWSLRYKHGQLEVRSDGQLVTQACSRALTSWCNAIMLTQLSGAIELTRFEVQGLTAGYTAAQRKLYDETNVLRAKAEAAKTAGDLKLAIRTEQQRIPLMKKAFGDNEVGIALVHEWINDIADDMKRFDAVKRLSGEAADAYERSVGADHPETLRMRVFQGYAMAMLGDLDGGEKLAREAGLNHYRLAGATGDRAQQVTAHLVIIFDKQAIRMLEMGRSADSRRYRVDNIQLLSATYGADSDYVTYQQQLHDLAALVENSPPEKQPGLTAFQLELIRFNEERSNGKVPTGEELAAILSRSLETLGKEHVVSAELMGSVAACQFNLGEFGAGLAAMEDSVIILERLTGSKSFKYAYAEGQLAAVYSMLEHYDEATPRFTHALEVFASLNKKETHVYAQTQLEYARHLIRIGNLNDARQLLTECIVRLEALGASTSSDAIVAMERLADVYRAEGDIANADAMLDKQRRLVQQSGDRGAGYLMTLTAEAKHLYMKRQFDKSAEKYQAALLEIAKITGKRSRAYEAALEGLLAVYAIQNDLAGASRAFGELLEFARMRRESLFEVYTLRQQFQQSASDRVWLNRLMAIASNGYISAEAAYEHLLGIKGAVTVYQRRVHIAASNPQLRGLFAQRQSANAQIMAMLGQPLSDENEKQLIELVQLRSQLDVKMSRESAAYRVTTQRIKASELRQLLPEDTAIVDYVEFERPPNWLEQVLSSTPRRKLAAFVVTKGQGVRLIDLGDAVVVESALLRWCQAIGMEQLNLVADFKPQLEKDTDQAGSVVRKLAWEPLSEGLGSSKKVLIAPDGALLFCPFAALPLVDGRSYLIEHTTISYIPATGLIPELLNESAPPTSGSLLLVGNIDYDYAADKARARSGDSESAVRFSRLPDGERALGAVRQYFKQRFPQGSITELVAQQATESRVRESLAPATVVHLHTHGFSVPISVVFGARVSNDRDAQAIDPLVAGIALAGANVSDEADGLSDGILWAEEISTLDFGKTDLVTLSACQTALGEVIPGEGMQGSQRALTVAGARSSLTSLWSVEDTATKEIMDRFYRRMWSDRRTKAEALRQAMIYMLREYSWSAAKTQNGSQGHRCPPWLWSGWVLNGNGQ
jgi:CHAT domain-containing protein